MTSGIDESIVNQYQSRTPRSRAAGASAKAFLPGGDSRSSTYYNPYPVYLERGQGHHVYDIDGNRYVDFLNNYTSLIHGHAHPAIIEAVGVQLKKGTVFPSPTVLQTGFAEILCERVPSIDTIRFCNSGTEATMMAMRAARAVTGRDIILLMEGGYHGTHDFVEVKAVPQDSESLPIRHVQGPGVPGCVLDGTMVSRFNDLKATRAILEKNHSDVAAIILEPMPHAGGMIPPRDGYLRGMRALADEFDVLLIFDEVATFRLSLGGLQLAQDIEPDLTALGKIIGGGFPVGAFGGKREIMERFDPSHPNPVKHSGTYNGYSIALVAGTAALEHYDQGAIDRVNQLGEMLRQGLNRAFQEVGIKGQATGLGSLVQVHWTADDVHSPQVASLSRCAAHDIPKLFHLELMNRGIFAAPRGAFNISTPMSEKEVVYCIDAVRATLGVLRPYAAQTAPHLVKD